MKVAPAVLVTDFNSMALYTVRPKKNGNPQSNVFEVPGPPRLLNALSRPPLLLKSVSVLATLNETVLLPELPAEPELVALSVSALAGQNQSLPAVELVEQPGIVESTKK